MLVETDESPQVAGGRKVRGSCRCWSTRGTTGIAREGRSSSIPGFLDLSTFQLWAVTQSQKRHPIRLARFFIRIVPKSRGRVYVGMKTRSTSAAACPKELAEHLDLQDHCHQENCDPVSRHEMGGQLVQSGCTKRCHEVRYSSYLPQFPGVAMCRHSLAYLHHSIYVMLCPSYMTVSPRTGLMLRDC